MIGDVKIVGIDPGFVNLGVCVVQTSNTATPTKWKRFKIIDGKASYKKVEEAVHDWLHLQEVKQMFEEADSIVLEEQIFSKYKVISTSIFMFYRHKCVRVHPKTMQAFYFLPVGKTEKKSAAVALSELNTTNFTKTGKRDDLADAYLLAMYGVFLKLPNELYMWKKNIDIKQTKKRKVKEKKEKNTNTNSLGKKHETFNPSFKQVTPSVYGSTFNFL